jgi:uncharacterized protein (TIGR03382 family)
MISVLLGVAMAFAPTSDDQGIEPHRVQYTHPVVQAQLHQSRVFQDWVREAGPWNAQFDEVTGQPLAMWGRGVPLPTGDEGQLVSELEALLLRHGGLFGAEPGQLALRSANYVQRLDTWYVEFDALRDGLSTYRGGISARIKHGNLVLLRVLTHPSAPVTGSLALSTEQAVQAAIVGGRAPAAQHQLTDVQPMLLERSGIDGLHLRKVYQVTTRTEQPVGIWVAFVDGETGEVLSVHNEVRFISGQATASHPVRTLDGTPFVTSPLPLAYVDDGVVSDYTDDEGFYDLPGAGPVNTMLAGEYLEVYDYNTNAISSGTAGAADFTWDAGDATQAEISSYVFLHHVKLWGDEVAPEVDVASFYGGGQLASIVNLPDVCNAYYDGNVNFFEAGWGCNNTAEIADVNYHEWGHGFHAWSLQAGFFDGSLSEGASDAVAFFQTGDALIAPFFGTNGSPIRNVGPDQVYPQDYSSSYYAVHSNGLIFGGAIWDLWDLLVSTEGEEAGTEITTDIFTGLLKGGPDIPASVYEALVADDDDGNLDNGTPHSCAIIEAFGQHGLGVDGIGTAFVPFHEPLVSVTPDTVTPLRLDVLASAADCIDLSAATGDLTYRVDGGSWLKVEAVSLGSASVEADLPALPMGSFVEYYFDGEDSDGNGFTAPSAGEAAPYSLFVGDVLEVACFDFESDDGGFTHELLAGEPSDGADDWQWGVPAGQSFDPSSAFSGDNVWANDLGQVVNGQPFNGAYQANKTNRLTSSVIASGHYVDVFLHYRRWLQVEDGLYDQARIYVDDEVVWSNHISAGGEEHHTDGQWMTHSVDLDGFADRTEFQVAWELQSDGGLEFGGWTLDDVCIYAPAHVDNRLAVLDLRAEVDNQGYVDFSWTQPLHGPYTELRIVRNDAGFPTSVDDGTVVYSETNPSLGASATARDDNASLSAGYYAIYTTDGDEWLSWTIEGWNAVATDASQFTDLETRPDDPTDDDTATDATDDGGSDEGEKSSAGGCGCQSAAPSVGWLLLGLPLLLRRRR